MGRGTETGTFTIAIVDNTMKQIEPKPTDEVEAAIVDAMNAGGRR